MEDKKTEGEKKVFFFKAYNKVEMLLTKKFGFQFLVLVYPTNKTFMSIFLFQELES